MSRAQECNTAACFLFCCLDFLQRNKSILLESLYEATIFAPRQIYQEMMRISIRVFSNNKIYRRTGFVASYCCNNINSFRNLTLYHIRFVYGFNYIDIPTCLSYKSNRNEDGLQQPLLLLYIWLTLFKSPNDIKAI